MNIEIANRLVELRKKTGLSQEELAEKLGISRQSVSKWERAEASPDTDNLILLSKIYGVSMDDLLNTEQPVEEIVRDNKEAAAEQEVVDPRPDDDDDEDDDEKRGPSLAQAITAGVGELLALVAYLIMGFAWTQPGPIGWAAGWVVFLIPPVLSSIISAIEDRKATHVAIPLLVVGVYCGMGIIGNFYGQNFWHPWWILFLFIPIYYSVFGSIEKALEQRKK